MKLLKRMKACQVPINWKTILVGWLGPGKFHRQLSIDDIVSYAVEQIVDPSKPRSDVAVRLATASQDEKDLVENCLNTLAADDPSDVAVETRKWRVFLLEDAMQGLSEDPLYGLIGLTEFWEKFDFPEDSPHTVQGQNNHITPGHYYTEGNLRSILEEHRKWIDQEKKSLNLSKSRIDGRSDVQTVPEGSS